MDNEGDEARAIGILERPPALVQFQNPPDGWTFLHAASAMLFGRMVVWLLDHGADVKGC